MYHYRHYGFDVDLRSARTATEQIVARELSRRERVSVCLLEGEKEMLIIQTVSDYEKIKNLQIASSAVSGRLDDARYKIRCMSGDLQRQNHNIVSLHEELERHETALPNHQKTISENVALNVQLQNLRTETETLRLQRSKDQEIMSEKLALERQLSSLEMELSIARGDLQKSRERLAEDDHEAETHMHVDIVTEKLSQEIQIRQRLEKQALESKTNHDSQNKVWESKVDTLKAKLNEMRTDLKQTQRQLLEARRNGSGHQDQEGVLSRRRARKLLGEQLHKTEPTVLSMSNSGNDGKRAAIRIRDRSSFSLTPHLKKTGHIVAEATDTSIESLEPEVDTAQSLEPVSVNSTTVQDSQGEARSHGFEVTEAVAGKLSKTLIAPDKLSSLHIGPSIEKYDGSIQNLNPTTNNVSQWAQAKMRTGIFGSLKPKKLHTEVNESDALRKRRKLPGGQSYLFSEDEDDDGLFEEARRAPGVRTAAIGKIDLLAPPGQAKAGKWDLGNTKFSPLKRQKRALQKHDESAFVV